MNVQLIRLSQQYQTQLGEMIEEWKRDQELNHTNHSPWAIFRNDYHDFDRYLDELDFKELSEKHVPTSTFFLLDNDRDRLIGAVNIRHQLNERLLLDGGHIGDGIRPSERGKGYATEMIRLALLECKKLGIDRVLSCCSKDNVASQRTIEKNGGVLENETPDPDDPTEPMVLRYWIQIH